MLALTRASCKALFKSPQSVFFNLFFPIVLIAIFGALGSNRGISVDIAFTKNSDTTNYIYAALANDPVLVVEHATEKELQDRLAKGRVTALVEIRKQDSSAHTAYDVHLKTSSAGKKDLPVLESILRNVITDVNNRATPQHYTYASISAEEVPGRHYRMIDFYLPGMLGFSLIGSAVFGVAFVFFSFRETLVLKRLFSTPIKKGYIVVGESLARIIFQMATAVVIIGFGKLFYGFTLAHGLATFFELLLLCLLGLLVFMGFGYAISGLSKTQNVIPVYANLFMFPQYFLSGTFFPKGALPAGIQPVINYLPLTALNDAMRKVSFEGLHLWDLGFELAVLLGWCVVAYALAIRTFKWE
ncbi:MAG: ABC transporter permease [Candidatus Pseudobacter hemicellulosilyticus]|uniref:ABC transporter permease n=1 Tax=Candidatus Pseudobacter hemicellulosilyticus TaxID=3121375 RepID=A0AAJ5WZS6_9BACT|nr:MAG: ABC transporter permease [Pseudobacter sp.]